MSSSRKRDFKYPRTRARSPPRRSLPRDRFYGSRRSEPERFSGLENQQQPKWSDHEDDGGELCMRKLSEFNESLQRQGQSASARFQWDNLLRENFVKEEAAAAPAKSELPLQCIGTATTNYPVSSMGIGLTRENWFMDSEPAPLIQMASCLSNNGEDLQCRDVGNRGMISEAVGCGGYTENFGFDSSPLICEMAMNRIRKTEEATQCAYRKMENMRSKATGVDSIVDKIDCAVENKALELHHHFLLPQHNAAEEKRVPLHGERNQLTNCCGRHGLTQGYPGRGGQGEEVVGFGMNHSGAFIHGERRKVQEDSGPALPPIYPDVIEKSRGNAMEQENEFLRCRMNHAQNKNGAVFHGDSQAFQHYIHLSGKLHQMEQEKEDSGSRMNCQHSQRIAPLHGEIKELPEGYCHSSPHSSLDFVRESRVMEHTNDIFSYGMTCSWPEKTVPHEKHELPKDYGHSLPRHYLDFNVRQMQQKHELHGFHSDIESHQMQQEHKPLASRMKHLHKQKVQPLHGEKRPIQEDCTHFSPQPHFGSSGESHVKEQENEVLASMVDHPQVQKGALFNGESQQLQQDCALESYPLPEQDADVWTTEGCTQQLSATDELLANSHSSKTHTKKRIIDLRGITDSRLNAVPQTSEASEDGEIRDFQFEGDQQRNEDFEQLLLPRNSGFQDERAVLSDELRSQSKINNSDHQVSSPHMRESAQPPNRKNIKQRLGPPVDNPKPSNTQSKRQRLWPPSQYHSSRKSIKQPLMSPSQVHSSNNLPQVEGRRNVKDVREGLELPGANLPNVKHRRTKEDFEEFKQLIYSAFLQFVKVLNDNPAQRRKYTGKAEADTLKCSVCGSKSKEFGNTLSLVTHAFTCQTVELRVKHLGLHKALCFLMGWNSMAASNGLWSQKTLSNAEALAKSEDLVIWPPVVILHNSSLATTSSDDRIIVSTEALKAFLIDMGFGRGISKVCRGKPANQSIMTVIFDGTLSGLKEAERLHKLYVENKHGRAEFHRISCGSGETQKMAVDKFEDVLYGYIGIASDLDKLDFETKSSAVIRSKKEICAIADGVLDTE